MFRLTLPAAVYALFAPFASAEELNVPGLSPEANVPKLQLPACDWVEGSQDNCIRSLACIGSDGLWFDGQVRGWGRGQIYGQRSDGVAACAGSWDGDSAFGSAVGKMECQDKLLVQVIYYSQDDATGTGIARGMDNKGRLVRAWTGKNVLQFLGDGDVNAAKLPCSEDVIPIS